MTLNLIFSPSRYKLDGVAPLVADHPHATSPLCTVVLLTKTDILAQFDKTFVTFEPMLQFCKFL